MTSAKISRWTCIAVMRNSKVTSCEISSRTGQLSDANLTIDAEGMRRRIGKKILLLAGLLTTSGFTLFGQTVGHPQMLHHQETFAIHVPPQEAPEGLKTIYSSLGTDPNCLYNYIDTWLVSGPNSLVGLADFIAMRFTPQSNSHVSEVRVAVLYDGIGADQVNLSIYADSNGHPGKRLAGPVTVTKLPKTFTCCGLAVADFASVPVNGGTQYWVVADTPQTGRGSDFVGEWAGAVSPVLTLAANAAKTGWVAFNGNGLPAGEVLGTVP